MFTRIHARFILLKIRIKPFSLTSGAVKLTENGCNQEEIMPFTVVIADDVTGANDIGIMYTKAGHSSVVYNFDKLEPELEFEKDVTIIDTNSRFLSYEKAYQRVYEATKCFGKDGVHQFIDKQCSVFRGNIGAEFDAMLDALEEEFAVVVLGFPDNGRTTLHGDHYVHGVKLEDSQFKNDPVHPMRKSNLVEILQEQTKRRVAPIYYEILDQGSEALRSKLEQMRTEANYAIIDVRNNEDLSVIAQSVKDEKIICGSSAIAYYLGLLHQSQASRTEKEAGEDGTEQEHTDKILCIAGSLTPQTKAQVRYMKEKHYPVIMLDTTKLFSPEDLGKEKERILSECRACYENNELVVIHSMNEEEDVARTKKMGADRQIDNTVLSVMVSDTLSELAKEIGDYYKIDKYIICGGDTSASFCNRQNIKGVKVLKEIEAGLPTCRSITKPFYQLVLKSGSFGSEQFIETAARVLTGTGERCGDQ